MSVIFEGIDGIGKTTEAQKFIELNKMLGKGYAYIHNFEKVHNALDTTSEANKEIILLLADAHLVFDRSYFISEIVYSRVLGRESFLTETAVGSFITIINANKHSVAFLYTDDFDILAQKDEDITLPFEALQREYTHFFDTCGIERIIKQNIRISRSIIWN